MNSHMRIDRVLSPYFMCLDCRMCKVTFIRVHLLVQDLTKRLEGFNIRKLPAHIKSRRLAAQEREHQQMFEEDLILLDEDLLILKVNTSRNTQELVKTKKYSNICKNSRKQTLFSLQFTYSRHVSDYLLRSFLPELFLQDAIR